MTGVQCRVAGPSIEKGGTEVTLKGGNGDAREFIESASGANSGEQPRRAFAEKRRSALVQPEASPRTPIAAANGSGLPAGTLGSSKRKSVYPLRGFLF